MKYQLFFILYFWFFTCHTSVFSQSFQVRGRVNSAENQEPLFKAMLFIENTSLSTHTNPNGSYQLEGLVPGSYRITAFYFGYEQVTQTVKIIDRNAAVNFTLSLLADSLDAITIKEQRVKTFGLTRLKSVEGLAIYEGKKNEVIILDEVVANKPANNIRQILAKVPGFNIWESDCAGLQIGVGGRGLSPNRNANFNTRQNGYDISADALGYPESYYSPPIQAVERIKIVRGAASLQYGTQFGGLVNFIMKKGDENKKVSFTAEESYNSLGFYNGFHSLGGSVGKLNYYVYNRFAKGDCWRCNSNFEITTTGINTTITLNSRFKLTLNYTNSYYLARQPGGLTDAQFTQNPMQSNRERNWFKVYWNLPSFTIDYRFSEKTKLNSRTFGLIAGRDALGNLGRIDRLDFGGNRDYLADRYRNIGNETRLIHYYGWFNQTAVLLVGTRFYRGFTQRKQGDGNDGSDANFSFLSPDNLEGSDFDFPGTNISAFAENIFNLNKKWSITPGIRFEFIRTQANGHYRTTNRDLSGNIIFDQTIPENKASSRAFVLVGLGVSHKVKDYLEFYGNFSQNYRSVTFNDIRVNNPNLVVDDNIRDERGYNADLGMRGNVNGLLNFDLSAFHLAYKDRIGAILQRVPDPELIERIIRFRTNLSDANIFGLEGFATIDLFQWIYGNKYHSALSVFANVAWIHARYTGNNDNSISGKTVELVPSINLKTGIAFTKGKFKASYQYSYVSRQYSEASNATFSASAVEGLIPAYQVMDISMAFKHRSLRLETGCNNLTNSSYFTRRASGYPGPGIISSDGRSFYLNIGLTVN